MILHPDYTQEAVAIAEECWREGMAMREDLTPAEWSTKERWIAQGASPLSTHGDIRYTFDRFPYCLEPTNETVNPEVQVSVWMFASGMAKALDVETAIATPMGWRTMRDIQIGDYVFGDDGRPVKVIAATDEMLGHACCSVEFSDGSAIIADEGHRWTTSFSKRVRITRAKRDYRYKIQRTKVVVTTAEIAKTLRCEHFFAHGIPLAKRLTECRHQPLIEAYSFGVWLGDGSSDMARISCGDKDAEEMMALLSIDGRSVRSKRYGNKALEIYLDNHGRTGRGNPFTKKLRAIGAYKNKHIPEACLFSPLHYRVALLQGLMDSDGTIDKNGLCKFTSTKEILSQGVLELVCGLGMKGVKKERLARCQTGAVSKCWAVQFFPGIQVFRLRRKADRVRVSTFNFERRIIAVRPVETRPVKCIAVESESHLYLAGKTLIPTHNTEMAVNVLGYTSEHAPTNKFVVFPKEESRDKFSRDVVQRSLIDATPCVQKVYVEAKGREAGNTIAYKRHIGGSMYLTSAGSASNFRGPRAGVVYCGEIDGFPDSAGEEGDPIALAFKRAEGFEDAIKILEGTPTIKFHSTIENWLNKSDKRMWLVPCRGCSRRQVLMWRKRPDITELQATVAWPKLGRNRHEKAVILCGHCARAHDDRQRVAMILEGVWKPTQQFNGIRGYWLNGLNTTLPAEKGFRSKMHQFAVDAHNAANSSNKRHAVRAWTNTFLAETFQEEQDVKMPWVSLLTRREEYPALKV